ncbi:MAG: Helix-turn-helix domain [Pseudomonadota bacterium]|jgi:cytoskeletal protein RodZ
MYNNIIADEMFDTYPQQKELGKLLRESREANEFSIHEMSEILKVSPSRLKQIEAGDFSIMHEIYTKSLVTRYAKHTNVNIERLFKQIWTDKKISVNPIDELDNIKSSSLFEKESAEIDKSGNHMYMFLGGVCAVALSVFVVKAYSGLDDSSKTTIADAGNTSISVLTLDKELKSYKTLSAKAKQDMKLSKSLLASNKLGEDLPNKSGGVMEASFSPDSSVPVSYIIKSNN